MRNLLANKIKSKATRQRAVQCCVESIVVGVRQVWITTESMKNKNRSRGDMFWEENVKTTMNGEQDNNRCNGRSGTNKVIGH